MAVAAVAWVLAAILASGSSATPLEAEGFEGPVTLTGEVIEGRFGPWAPGEIESGSVLVDLNEHPGAGRGDRLDIVGTIGGEPGTASGRAYRAVLTVRKVESVTPSSFLPHRAGRVVTRAVDTRLRPHDDGRALLAGFLIGDTSHISDSDIDAMRRSGLAHFVAVSGSNVALFLALLAVAAGPLAVGPRRRAALGLLALPVYVAATRFEPSVMRAAFMAGIALVGRLVGMVLEAWQLLALAVTVLLLGDPFLVSNVGFQLSVAATMGVLVGARWPVGGSVGRALVITLGAQVAVAPLLLLHFGTVPLLSPLVNLVAAPLVAGSTAIGAVGVAGVGLLIPPAAWIADVVLVLARGAAGWPQLSPWELSFVAGAVGLVTLVPRARLVFVGGTAVFLTVVLVTPGTTLGPAQVVVLDVGQGDAILVHGGNGHYALVDGGPDERRLLERLRDYGVRSVDLVVLTHVHADHATGLTGVVESLAVGQVWAVTEPHSTEASRAFMDATGNRSVAVAAPEPGAEWQLGDLTLSVEGPVRRYASPNDQSIVVTVEGPRRTMLLSGDIETHAQADLADLRADVLKVPHQGAGTSSPDWLSSVGSRVAVISVGPNEFGHPVDWVVEVLEETNEVLRTDQDGDVVVDLTVSGP